MSLRHPRYTARLLEALLAAGTRVRLDGDTGEGISSSRRCFLAGLELLTSRVENATAGLGDIREVLLKDGDEFARPEGQS
jgi:hypothetical protein